MLIASVRIILGNQLADLQISLVILFFNIQHKVDNMKRNKVFFAVSMSLDGYIAPEGMDLAHADYPTYKNWLDKLLQVREPWLRPGGTTFYFENDGIMGALEKAKEVAGNRDIRIGGGADVIQQYLDAGLVDEFIIHLSPVFFGGGIPLFKDVNENIALSQKDTLPSEYVTHITYEVKPNHLVPIKPGGEFL